MTATLIPKGRHPDFGFRGFGIDLWVMQLLLLGVGWKQSVVCERFGCFLELQGLGQFRVSTPQCSSCLDGFVFFPKPLNHLDF